jgi:3-oxoacyl-[acyl-carrier-protein] synthase-3
MSRRIAAKITGVSGYVPPRVMSNADLEKLVDTNDAWIRERTGIRERHVVDPGVATSDLATAAARKLLECKGVPATEIDLNYQDRATCVLFGDGAGAVLLEPTDRDDEGILDFEHEVDGSGGKFLYMPGGGSLHPASAETVEKKMHYIHQEGAQVFKYAVRRMAELACQMLERNGFTSKDLALVIPHQANLRIIRAMQERLGVEDSKVMINIERYGNTTAGTIPLGLQDAVEQGKLKEGDLVLLVAVGAGYTAGGVLLRWAY